MNLSIQMGGVLVILKSAANRLIGEVVQSLRRPLLATRAFSWLKAPTSAFTFKTRADIRHYANQTSRHL